MSAKRVVFLAYTKSERLPQPELLRVYSKYQAAYNWLADLAERHDNALHPLGQKLPAVVSSEHGGRVILQTMNPTDRQTWWLERWEVS